MTYFQILFSILLCDISVIEESLSLLSSFSSNQNKLFYGGSKWDSKWTRKIGLNQINVYKDESRTTKTKIKDFHFFCLFIHLFDCYFCG